MKEYIARLKKWGADTYADPGRKRVFFEHAKFVVAGLGVLVTAVSDATHTGSTGTSVVITAVTAFFVWLVPNLEKKEGPPPEATTA